MLWMDKHEKGGMKSMVEAVCEEVRMLDDFGGDYAVGGFLIERKRWNEVAGRMTDQERGLFYQVEKLCSAADELGVKPALMLEGEIGAPLNHSRIPPGQIARHLAGLPVLGVTVIPSTGQRCSADILARLEDGTPPDARRVRGSPDDESHRERFIIEGFPDIGPSTAEDLLEHFGDVRSVLIADREALMEVDGVGPVTAEKIVGTLNGETA